MTLAILGNNGIATSQPAPNQSNAFAVKDRSLRYVKANAAMLEFAGAADLLGRSAHDVFPDLVARREEAIDRRVMRTRMAALGRLSICVRLCGEPVAALIGSSPMIEANDVVGIATVVRPIVMHRPDRRSPAPMSLATPVAASAQLMEDLVATTGLPLHRCATVVRLMRAMALLRERFPIAEVARRCGYENPSAFSHRFETMVGMSPSRFRRWVSSADARRPRVAPDLDLSGQARDDARHRCV